MGYLITALILAMVAGILIVIHAVKKEEAEERYQDTQTEATRQYYMDEARTYLLIAILCGGVASGLTHYGAERIINKPHTVEKPAHVDTTVTFSGLKADTTYTYTLKVK